ALAQGIPDLLSTIDDNGIHILGALRADDSNISKRQTASGNHVQNLADNFSARATQYLDIARDYIDSVANPTIFPTYYNLNIKDALTPSPDVNQDLRGSFTM